jgi:hypothetical protein
MHQQLCGAVQSAHKNQHAASVAWLPSERGNQGSGLGVWHWLLSRHQRGATKVLGTYCLRWKEQGGAQQALQHTEVAIDSMHVYQCCSGWSVQCKYRLSQHAAQG